MPPAHAHEDDTADAAAPCLGEGPLRPADIDRVLTASSDAGHAGPSAPLRVWRDDLVLARGSLCYAETVLMADVAILRHCLATETDAGAVVDALPQVVAPRAEDETSPGAPRSRTRADVDLEAVVRADHLVSAHHEMARVDLSSHVDVARVLDLLEHQLCQVGARRLAVEERLYEIRAAIIRRYQDGIVPSLDRPA